MLSYQLCKSWWIGTSLVKGMSFGWGYELYPLSRETHGQFTKRRHMANPPSRDVKWVRLESSSPRQSPKGQVMWAQAQIRESKLGLSSAETNPARPHVLNRSACDGRSHTSRQITSSTWLHCYSEVCCVVLCRLSTSSVWKVQQQVSLSTKLPTFYKREDNKTALLCSNQRAKTKSKRNLTAGQHSS